MKTNELARKLVNNFNKAKYTENCFVEILEMNGFDCDKSEKLKLGVNWAALGTVTAEEAVKRTSELSRALDIIAIVNDMNLTIEDWSRGL